MWATSWPDLCVTPSRVLSTAGSRRSAEKIGTYLASQRPVTAAIGLDAMTIIKSILVVVGILSICCLTGCETTGGGYQQSYANEPEGC